MHLTDLDRLRGYEMGAVDYIPKDAFAEAVLLETIKQITQQKNSGLS